jgi:transposase-like protein
MALSSSETLFSGAVRWYVAHPRAICYRQLEEMMSAWDVEVDHSRVNRRVLKDTLGWIKPSDNGGDP